ncbi:MAG TPA: PLP-dependent transferase, partial [Rhizomicrobium sp.]|nr:PLP-dependent transferase [Rhizomicrobium sp.]
MAPVSAVAGTEPAKRDMVVHTGTPEDNLFTRIGVRPILNARGTYTIISGSRSLPEVKQAMFEAGHYYVQMDEMMEGVGKELARLNGCESAMVTNGCEAAIILATIACVAGSNIEKCQALPYVKAKDQVIIPKHSRNPYDVGVRVVGAEVIEVETPDQLRAKISPRTAMIYVTSDPREAKSPLPIPAIIAIAKEKNIPVFVDAAAEEPMSPNVYMKQGASFVGYSGGKCLRAPQSSG